MTRSWHQLNAVNRIRHAMAIVDSAAVVPLSG
jgi:hypothetical protein